MTHCCPGAPESGCGVLWYDRGEWIFDTDDGLRGPVITYCPWCGINLYEMNERGEAVSNVE